MKRAQSHEGQAAICAIKALICESSEPRGEHLSDPTAAFRPPTRPHTPNSSFSKNSDSSIHSFMPRSYPLVALHEEFNGGPQMILIAVACPTTKELAAQAEGRKAKAKASHQACETKCLRTPAPMLRGTITVVCPLWSTVFVCDTKSSRCLNTHSGRRRCQEHSCALPSQAPIRPGPDPHEPAKKALDIDAESLKTRLSPPTMMMMMMMMMIMMMMMLLSP
jgi:hypothetical protein